jgi:hypothetical protein
VKHPPLLFFAIGTAACTNSDWFKLQPPDGPCIYPSTDDSAYMSYENTERWISRFCESFVRIGSALDSFQPDLYIQQTDAVDLEGLQCLCGVAGFLKVGGNPHLETLDGLEGLVELSGIFLGNIIYWTDEDGFYDLNGEPEPNPMLEDIRALEQIEKLDVGIVAYAKEARLPSQLAGLDTAGTILLKDVTDTAPIELPPNLQVVDELVIEGAQDASALILPTLLSEVGHIHLKGVHGITDLDVPDSVTNMSYLGVIGADQLQRVRLPATAEPVSLSLLMVPSLADLSAEARALGSLTIMDAPSLVTTTGLSTAERLADLFIYRAEQLQDLAGFGGSREDGASTHLVDLARLTSTSPLRMPSRSGGIVLSNLPVLPDLAAFEGVISVTYAPELGLAAPLTLERLPALPDLTALHSLQWVSGP